MGKNNKLKKLAITYPKIGKINKAQTPLPTTMPKAFIYNQ